MRHTASPSPSASRIPPIFIGGDSNATVKRVIRHNAGWISNPNPVEAIRKRIDQMRDGAGHDVPLAMFGAPPKPHYWHALDDLGFDRVGLMLPTLPTDESLQLLDDHAAMVDQYRS